MSLRVVGYLNGRRVVDEGEAHARVSGYGGSALGHAITVVHAAPTIRSDRDIARQRRRAETKRLWREAHPR